MSGQSFVCRIGVVNAAMSVKEKLRYWQVREENFAYDLPGLGQTFKDLRIIIASIKSGECRVNRFISFFLIICHARSDWLVSCLIALRSKLRICSNGTFSYPLPEYLRWSKLGFMEYAPLISPSANSYAHWLLVSP